MAAEFHEDDKTVIKVNMTTLHFGDITGFKTVVSFCLVFKLFTSKIH